MLVKDRDRNGFKQSASSNTRVSMPKLNNKIQNHQVQKPKLDQSLYTMTQAKL